MIHDSPYVVERWLRIRMPEGTDDPPFHLDADGFLAPPRRWSGLFGGLNDDLIRPTDALASRGALVLLGEPGLGKTTTFNHVAPEPDDDPEPGEPGAVWVRGAELTDQADLDQRVARFLTAWSSGVHDAGATLTIVFDQLDESQLRANGFARRLQRILKTADTRNVRILVACRTADIPTDLPPILTACLGQCVIADLAPLTRQDAVALAQSASVDGAACIDAIVAAGAGGLASVPLILELLVHTYATNPSAMHSGPTQVFERGVRALASEWDQHRDRTGSQTTPDHRLAVAGRIAARALLSGRRSIRTDRRAATSTDMTDSSLPGGAELVAGAPFEVTTPILDETLATALFTSAGHAHVAFRHSSVAAFLAARYLTDLAVPQAQLQGLLLVDAVDQDSSAIPTPLHETAAWYIQMNPTTSLWLAAADPAAVLAYSTYLTDADTRRALVDGLLNNVQFIVHGSWSWQPSQWHLNHPDLAAQLRPALTDGLVNDQPVSQDTADRLWLAVRIAEDSAAADLAEPLLQIVEHVGVAVSIRHRAARAAYRLDVAQAAPRLRSVLARLQPGEDTTAAEHGDMDELAGEILLLMWPDQLTLDDVLPHLHRPGQVSMRGALWEACRVIPWRTPADQLAPLLEYVVAHSDADESDPDDASIDPDDPPLVGSVPTATVDALIARCLALSTPDPYLPMLAVLIAPRLLAHTEMPMPAALDLVDAQGSEPLHATTVRRQLALALVNKLLAQDPHFGPGQGYAIGRSWRTDEPAFGWSAEDAPPGFTRANRNRLLDTHDFAWGMQTTDALRENGQTDLADAVGLTACMAADPRDPATRALGRTREGTPEWTYIEAWYLPPAERPWSRPASARQRTPFDPTAFREAQRDRYERAITSDTTAYAEFVHDLKFDPETGQPQDCDSDDLRTYPGIAALDRPIDSNVLVGAALTYLTVEHDHRDKWLGQPKWCLTAVVGDLSLALLHHAGRISDLPTQHWAQWPATLFTLHWGHAGRDTNRVRAIVHQLNQHAPIELAAAVRLHVTGSLNTDGPAAGLEYLGHLAAPADTVLQAVTDVATDLVRDATDSAPVLPTESNPDVHLVQYRSVEDTWRALLRLLLDWHPQTASQLATHVFTSLDATDDYASLAAATALTLLEHDPHRAWPQVHAALQRSQRFAATFTNRIYHDDKFDAILTELDVDELNEFYRTLAHIRPPDLDEIETEVMDIVALPSNIFRPVRDQVLRSLIRRGTADAVRQVRALSDEYPTVHGLRTALAATRRNHQEQSFPQLTPESVAELFLNPRWRVAHTNNQFAAIIIDCLRQIEDDLQTHGNLLWDCERNPKNVDGKNPAAKEKWRPKPEEALSAYLCHELTLRLGLRGIVVNREVQVRPTDARGAGGERVDLLAHSRPHRDPRRITPDTELGTLSVTIEIKGSWNNEVPTAQTEQLAKRYLRTDQDGVGVYLVAVFPLDQWTSADSRKSEARRRSDVSVLQQELDAESETIRRQLSVRTHPLIITISRAHKAPKR